jgi:hypothetical protein
MRPVRFAVVEPKRHRDAPYGRTTACLRARQMRLPMTPATPGSLGFHRTEIISSCIFERATLASSARTIASVRECPFDFRLYHPLD